MKRRYSKLIRAVLTAALSLGLQGCLSTGVANFTSSMAFSSTQGPGSAQLAWISNPGEQEGFRVEASTDGTTFTVVQQLAANANSANVTGLAAGTIYYFRVRGYNSAGTSPYSAVVTASIPAAPAAN